MKVRSYEASGNVAYHDNAIRVRRSNALYDILLIELSEAVRWVVCGHSLGLLTLVIEDPLGPLAFESMIIYSKKSDVNVTITEARECITCKTLDRRKQAVERYHVS